MNVAGRLGMVVAASLLIPLLARATGARADISITPNANLSFGQLIATSTPGTVTVTPAGIRSASGGVVLASGLGVSAASFTVSGDADRIYSLTLPGSTSLTAGAYAMTADGFTSSPVGSGNLGPGGAQQVFVGASLHVGASQPAAPYSGTYLVTVGYN